MSHYNTLPLCITPTGPRPSHPLPHCPLTWASCHLECRSCLALNSRLTVVTKLTSPPWGYHLVTDSPWNNYHLMCMEGGSGSSFHPSCAAYLIPKRCQSPPMARHWHFPSYPDDDFRFATDRRRSPAGYRSDLFGSFRRVFEGGRWLRNPSAPELVRQFC